VEELPRRPPIRYPGTILGNFSKRMDFPLDRDDKPLEPVPAGSRASWWIFATIGLFAVGGLLAFLILSRPAEPISEEIAADPLLVKGREIYLANCVNCHGPSGLGDGPLANNLTPRPRNLAKDTWKYGETPEQVLTVLANGVKDAQMPAFAGTFPTRDLKAVAAYVYQIARKPVPDALRSVP
jgi:mono/diheme cytochrome c family protein